MIDIVKFAETVQQMRTAQKEFFRTKSGIALNQSKKLEKEVDEMARAHAKPAPISQGDIFGNPLPLIDPELKHEFKFCKDQGLSVNEHGHFIYVSASGNESINLPYILSDYRNWLINQGISKDYQRS